MKSLLITAVIFALSACGGIQHKPLELANGKPAYTMDCSGFSHTLDLCIQKAEELCAQGFSIVKNKTYTIEHPISPDGYYNHPTRVVAIECDANKT